MFKTTRRPLLIFLIISSLQCLAIAGTPQVTYQGRILTAAGEAVTRPITFRLQIRSPGNEDCIMYEETQSQDLTNTNGIFSLALNGPGSTRTDGGSYSFSRIFANRGTFTFASGQCASGVNYVTAATDNRNLKVYFNDGSGWESLPLQSINPVPLAVEAMQVGGFNAASLLRVEDNGVLGNVAPLSTDYFNELISLITGVSTQYTKASSNGTVVIPQTNSPANLAAGQLWYDSGTLKYYNGITTVTLNSSGSSVTTSQLPMGTTSDTVAAGNDSRIVNAIQNTGFAKSIQVGADAGLPTNQVLGRFYVASDSQKIYYDNGTVWITVAQGNALAGVTSSTVITALGYKPLDPANNLSDLVSSATARTNLGLGNLSTLGFIDLSSSYVSGTLSVSSLADAGAGVTSGSQYTKVTVDGKGRVISGTSLSSSDVTAALGYTPSDSASDGITTLNGSSSTTQTFATGSSGTSFGVTSANGVHTFNIPLASASSVTAGLLSNADYVTFQNKLEATSSSVITALGYTPVNSGTVGAFAWLTNLDLGSSLVSGTLSVARLPSFTGDLTSNSGTNILILSNVGAGVTSGTQYTKVTVDGKGRVTSGASLSSSDVTAALGYTPSNSASAGINTLNGSSATTQTFATGSSGTSFGVTTSNGVHTFNIPLASASSVTAGLLSNADYVTFQNKLEATSSAVITALGYTPVNSGTVGALAWLNTLDLGSSLVSGTLSVARLPALTGDVTSASGTNIIILNDVGAGVTSGTQYTKVTVDGKGRVTSGASLSSSDVVSALGYTPANVTSGVTSINGSVSQTQTFATGVNGTSFSVSSANGVHTFNIPLASASSVTAGLLSNTDYVTFQNKLEATSSSVITALGYTPVNSGTVGTLAWLNTLDLGSSLVSGTLSVARLPAFVGDVTSALGTNVITLNDVGAGVTSGSQYTKVTVDSKGRVISGTSLSSSDVTAALGYTPSNSASAGIHTLNGSSATTQTFATGTTGTSFGVTTSNGVHTFNIPLASASSVTAGLLSNADYVTFQNKLEATSSAVITALGYTPVNSGTVGALAWLNTLDLGSSLVSGTLSVARLPAFAGDVTSAAGTNVITLNDVGSGVTSGSQYTKVTVDGKGRVTSGASLSSGDVVSALGYTPANSTSGVTSMNGSVSQTQTFATGTTGTAFGVTTSNGVHTFNIPLASASSVTAGLLSNTDYVTFQNKLEATSSSVITALGYTPVNSGTVGALAWINTLDLGSSLVSGTLSVARLPAFTGDVTSTSGNNVITLNDVGAGVTSGTQYTKITVDGKGRVTSGASLSSSDVTSALGYTPSNSASAGIHTLNGSSATVQTFVTGSSGTSFGVTTSNGIHTFNIPLASASSVTAGLLSNADYVTFQNKLEATSSSVITALGYTPVNSGTVGALAWLSTLDLGSSLVSGTLSVARLPAFTGDVTSTSGNNIITLNDVGAGVTSGTQYTKVTVDGKGRVTSGASLSSSDVTAALGYTPANVTSGVTSMNGSVSQTQTFVTGSGGTDFGIVTSNGVHTFNIPLASASSVTAGLLSNVDYITFQNKITSSAASIAQVLGYVPAVSGAAGVGTLLSANNLSDLVSSATARTNLGLGSFATASSIDLGSASATGIIDEARLATQSNVTSGTQYTKITVDGKGRVTSGTSLSSSDVTAALGYIPANSTSATQWATSGTSIYYTGGNVGVGTSSPGRLFEVNSAATAATLGIKGTSDGSQYSNFVLENNSNSKKWSVSNRSAAPNTDAMMIWNYDGASYRNVANFKLNGDVSLGGNYVEATNSGSPFNIVGTNVGIGTSSPATLLSVSSSSADILSLGRTGFNNWVFRNTHGGLGVNTNSLIIKPSSTYGVASDFAVKTTTADSGNPDFVVNSTGNVGIGTAVATAKLHIASGTASVAPLKFTSGTLLSSPVSGSVEYDGFNLYYTDSSSTRRTLASIDSSGAQTNTSIISNSGNITLAPTGAVIVSSTTASTNYTNGALVVSGGVGVAGTLNVNGSINTSGTIRTGSLVMPSSVSGITIFNTTDQTTNYEKFTASWSGNVFTLGNDFGSAASARALKIGVAATNSSGINRTLNIQSSTPFFTYAFNGTTLAGYAVDIGGGQTVTGSAGTQGMLSLTPTVGQSSTAGYKMLFISPYEQSLGSATSYLMDVGTNSAASGGGTHSPKFVVTSTGNVGIGTSSPTELLEVVKSQNASTKILVQNTSAGGNATAGLDTWNGSKYGSFGTTSTGYAGYGVLTANNSYILADGGITLAADSASGVIKFGTGTSVPERMRIDSSGNVGIGISTPTAKLHLASGTASLSPLKFTSGTLLTSPASGAIEYDGFNLYFTDGTDTRRVLATTAAVSGSYLALSGGTMTGALVHANGTVSAPSLSFANDATTGIYAPSAGAMAISTLGVERMRVVSGGNVGIGTATPGTTLQVSSPSNQGVLIGAGTYPSWMGTNGLYVEGSFRASGYLVNSGGGINWGASQAKIVGYSPNTGSDTYLSFYTGGITANGERLRIIDNGNVGIGTIAPTALLQLAAGTSSSASLKLTSGTLLTSAASGAIEYDGFNVYFTDGTNTRRRFASVDSTGTQSNASIISNSSNITLAPTGSVIVSSTTASTNSATGALIVSGGVGVAGNIYASGTIVTSSNIQGASITATNGVSTTVITGAPYLALNPNGGNVGVGTTVPPYRFVVTDGTTPTAASVGTPQVSIQANGPSYYHGKDIANGIEFLFGNSALGYSFAGSSTNHGFGLRTNNTDRIYITAAGNVGIGTTAPSTTLEVISTTMTDPFQATRYSNGYGPSFGASLMLRRANGTTSSPTAVTSGDVVGGIYASGYTGSAFGMNSGAIRFLSTENWSATSQGTSIEFATNSNGTLTRSARMLIDQSGNVGIGVTAPSARLTVSGTGSTSATASFNVMNGAGTSLMYVRNDGYVGIGTNSPSQSFSVIGSGYISSGFGVGAVADANYGALRVKGSTADSTANALHVHNTALTPILVARNDGNVGICTSSATVRLEVSGTIVGRTVANTTTTIDFSTANLQYTTSDCTTFNLAYMKDGGSYAFAVQGTNSAVCAFNAYSGASGTGALTVHMPPDHGASMAGTHTLYNFIVMGTHVYVSWTKGY